MEKKLTARILAMYLGCEASCKYRDDIGRIEEVTRGGEIVIGYNDNYDPFFVCTAPEITLHLRPLSDLTEQEAREMYELKTGLEFDPIPEFMDEGDPELTAKEYFDELVEIYDDTIQVCIGKPEIWHYLLLHGFDLFGLIYAGEAIDKTKIKAQ